MTEDCWKMWEKCFFFPKQHNGIPLIYFWISASSLSFPICSFFIFSDIFPNIILECHLYSIHCGRRMKEEQSFLYLKLEMP